MLIFFRTLQMDRLELKFPLIKACLQDLECPPSMCQPITVAMATTPAVFTHTHTHTHTHKHTHTHTNARTNRGKAVPHQPTPNTGAP